MITEKEYINLLNENKGRGANGENDEFFSDSFFRSIIPQVGAAAGVSDEKNKATEDENQVLKEINEQHSKKI